MAKTLVQLMAEKAKLEKQMAEIAVQEAECQASELKRISGLIDGLPKLFGMLPSESGNAAADQNANLLTIAGWIRSRVKGTFGSLTNTVRTYVRLTKEQKAEITTALKAGGPGNQVSELANKFGVSVPTVYALKKKAGLTETRKVAVAGKKS